MHKRIVLAVPALLLGVVLPLAAQTIQSGSAVSSTSNGQNFTPMRVGPYSGSGVSRLNQGVKNFFSWLPGLNPLSGHTSLPGSNFPTEAQMPGMDYLKQFGYRVAMPAQ